MKEGENNRHVAQDLRKIWGLGENLPILKTTGRFSHAARQSLQGVIASPVTSVLTCMTISICLLLLAAFMLTLQNMRQILTVRQSGVSLSVFIHDGLDQQKTEALVARANALPEVESVKLRSKEEALTIFKKSLGDQSTVLEGLESSNPLPASLEIKFDDDVESSTIYEQYAADLSSWEGVEHVNYSRGVVSRLASMVRAFRLAGWIAMLVMLTVTAFIIANTITLALYAHRDEVEIMKLVGATGAFIQAPYLIEGCVQGIIGSVASISLLYLGFMLFRSSAPELEVLQSLNLSPVFLSFPSICVIIASGVIVGAAGSFFAVRKFLRA